MEQRFGKRIGIDKTPVAPTVARRLGIVIRRQGVLLLKESFDLGMLSSLDHGLHLHDEQLCLAARFENMADGHHTALVEIEPLAIRLGGLIAKGLKQYGVGIMGMLQHIPHGQTVVDDGLLVVEIFLA